MSNPKPGSDSDVIGCATRWVGAIGGDEAAC